MAKLNKSDLEVGDIVTHTGKRGFWDIEKGYKGIGIVMSPLYKMYDRKYVHDIWFSQIGQIQQIGARALIKVNGGPNELEQERRTNLVKIEG